MRRRLSILVALVLTFVCMNIMTAFASGADITSYAFADIAGSISGNTINVWVPYSTQVTYWNHKVQVSEGATFTSNSITKVSDKLSTGTITVKGSDGSSKTYTVNINKNDFVGPEYDISKAKSIKKNQATFTVKYLPHDAVVTQARIVYYEKKANLNYRSLDRNSVGTFDVDLTGLKEGTKYTAYLEITTADKTYTTGGKSFTTKKSTDSGTSSSSSSSSSSSKKTTSSKGTNSDGSNSSAMENKSKKNEWSEEDGKWYYYGADGFSKVGWFTVGDKTYYAEKGTNELYMDKWKNMDKKWYYFDPSGALAQNGWAFINNKWYWMGSSGSMTQNQDIEVEGKTYSIAPDGTCADGSWYVKDGRWQYYKPGSQGLAKNETFVVDGIQYTADANGFVN